MSNSSPSLDAESSASPGKSAAPARLPAPVFHDPKHHIKIYQGDCLEILAAIPENSIDLIFADPPYFLSNDGITCHAGRMVSVNKGQWDKSKGADLDHEFNRTWIAACRRVLKPNGTLWVSGTAHVIHSVGFAMQQLEMKLLNDITWVKPNPPPNLSCRYFTHATETLIWAAKSRKSRHTFNYKLMRELAGGKQMKSVWTIPAPDRDEKRFGKHPTQKPVALLERILLAASNEGDLVLDPFAGSGTTVVAAVRLRRAALAFDRDESFVRLALRRVLTKLIVATMTAVSAPISLDLGLGFMDRSVGQASVEEMAPESKLVHRESKYFFVGAQRREIVYCVEAASLEAAWQSFHANSKSSEPVFSVIKTQTEIYLTQ
ncbi:MAG TPA: site-specific DNA-methyltransferase [Terriglobia bacterium]|nr:site-specific DNA-methyltransferase [Terriglobia bacterium]